MSRYSDAHVKSSDDLRFITLMCDSLSVFYWPVWIRYLLRTVYHLTVWSIVLTRCHFRYLSVPWMLEVITIDNSHLSFNWIISSPIYCLWIEFVSLFLCIYIYIYIYIYMCVCVCVRVCVCVCACVRARAHAEVYVEVWERLETKTQNTYIHKTPLS